MHAAQWPRRLRTPGLRGWRSRTSCTATSLVPPRVHHRRPLQGGPRGLLWRWWGSVRGAQRTPSCTTPGALPPELEPELAVELLPVVEVEVELELERGLESRDRPLLVTSPCHRPLRSSMMSLLHWTMRGGGGKQRRRLSMAPWTTGSWQGSCVRL